MCVCDGVCVCSAKLINTYNSFRNRIQFLYCMRLRRLAVLRKLGKNK